MKTVVTILAMLVAHAVAVSGNVSVSKVHGDVKVRHGVAESWIGLSAGEILGPEATIRTDKNGSAILVVNKGGVAGTINLPSGVMVDMSDIRELTPEELMLKLTMLRVRSTSYEWKSNELNIPNTTIVHGTDASAGAGLKENDPAEGLMFMNGTRLLFDNGFYSTCVLKSLDVMRRFPSLATSFDNRWLVAEALEKAKLTGEALSEYAGITSLETLTEDQKARVHARIARLRKRGE